MQNGVIDAVPGVSFAIPVIEGQVLAKGNVGAGSGALVRGLREEDIAKLQLVAKNARQGTFEGFNTGGGGLSAPEWRRIWAWGSATSSP